MDCLFCKIISKGISEHVIYEDENAFAFLDIDPRAPGHTLVVPKEHAETILELSEKNVGPLFQAVKMVVASIKKGLQPEGFTIGINHGKKAGQAIDHLHVHIIPRFKEDTGGSIHTIVHNPPNEDLQKIAERIRIDH